MQVFFKHKSFTILKGYFQNEFSKECYLRGGLILCIKRKGAEMKGRILNKKTVSAMVCILMVVILGVNASLSGEMTVAEETTSDAEERGKLEKGKEVQNETENSFTEEGTMSMGTTSQMPEFALNRVLMYVEEVYAEAGDMIKEGEPLFKIAEECIEEAKDYYESAVSAAEDTLTEAELSYESGELEASYLKLDTETKAESAAAELETALAELDSEIQKKYETWQATAGKIAAYYDNFYNNIYYANAGIPEKDAAVVTAQTAYDTALGAYQALGTTYEAEKAAFDAAVTELEAVAAGTSVSGLTIEDAAGLVIDGHQRLLAVESLYEEAERTNRELEQAKQILAQAKSEYEKNTAEAEKALEQLESSVDALEQNYEAASLEAETKRLELQKSYEIAVLEGEYAQTTYNETVEKLKTARDSAEKTLEDLKEEQAALLALENGVVCANQSGTLASVAYGVEDVLFAGTGLASYYDTATLTISLEIEQENIAKIAVGDEVSVAVSGNRRGNITGKVASIASSATTGRSVSDVTYTVVVSIENENQMLSAGTSATVTFVYGE